VKSTLGALMRHETSEEVHANLTQRRTNQEDSRRFPTLESPSHLSCVLFPSWTETLQLEMGQFASQANVLFQPHLLYDLNQLTCV
jgi:hypothetical protein